MKWLKNIWFSSSCEAERDYKDHYYDCLTREMEKERQFLRREIQFMQERIKLYEVKKQYETVKEEFDDLENK